MTDIELSPFTGVPDVLASALQERGFTSLTEVQQSVVHGLEDRSDLRISSQTGSGKTVALGLAVAQTLLAGAEEGRRPAGPTVLVVVPTRELAAQVKKELEWLFDGLDRMRVEVVTGGTNVENERRRLSRGPKVLVGTPGRLVDHIRSGSLVLDDIGELVLDEADQMLEFGFRDDLDAIVDACPPSELGRRTHMVSATFPKAVLEIAERYQGRVRLLEGKQAEDGHQDILHVGHLTHGNDRMNALVNVLLLEGERRVLVFVATRAAAASLSERLSALGFPAQSLSGDLAQSQRTATMEAFRSGIVRVLVATDVAARGLDVPDVATVVHGDLPMDAEAYTHRSGRTGRAGKKGRSVMLATPRSIGRARRIADDAGVDIDWQPVPSADQVRRARAGRLRKELTELVGTIEPDQHALELADSLLTKQPDAGKVIAALIAQLQSGTKAEPVDVETPAARQPRPPRPGRGRDGVGGGGGEAGFTQFRINWGGRKGANPRRILAAVCRRGDIPGKMVGAIEIAGFDTVFGVRDEVVDVFERNAGRPDERHPYQRIERLR